MAGLFGGLFDFNHDGKMEGFERTMKFMAFEKMMEEGNHLKMQGLPRMILFFRRGQ